ncbi:MAG: hypothetical protein P0Y53_14715 [Candidatus Pseudobacter hemicellulosilyticus]|uniref:Uncharacterized protein n=1 Tax=Candidatus Pseudobacter hemicellulosilyticus TaxID=3121375 RepID=A0AAJ6BG55_9BACT|nr:MAG: hypothetical protein P0Y53_14715 [Pseudobacter sp.]
MVVDKVVLYESLAPKLGAKEVELLIEYIDFRIRQSLDASLKPHQAEREVHEKKRARWWENMGFVVYNIIQTFLIIVFLLLVDKLFNKKL